MDYYKILKLKSDFFSSFEDLVKDANNNLEFEIEKAIRIQSVYRGFKRRQFIKFKNKNAIIIQRVFRGHNSRQYIKDLKFKILEEKNIKLFNCFALIIQKYFRGYYSRKYKCSHFTRKEFIKNLIEKSAEIRDMQYEYSIQQALRDEQESRETKDAELKLLTENLHHLISTAHIRGIFNPPPQFLKMPTMKDIPVEEHLRGASRNLLRTQGYAKTISDMKPDINGTLRIPIKGLKNKLSLQASAPFDALEKQKKSDNILHNVISTDRNHKFFVSGGKTDILNDKFVPLSTGDRYIDPWNNPLLQRGVPKSQKELIESAYSRKALFASRPDVPFLSRTGGNMSNVLPTTFDVIAEAQETGGVLKRHLGTTLRFGVPDNCDNRPQGGIIPTEPPRSSTLRQTRPIIKKHRITVQSIINSAKLQVGENLAIIQLREKYLEKTKLAKAEDPLASSDEDESYEV